jgi:hypothetical protein
MLPTDAHGAIRITAKTKAYACYCQQQGFAMPFEDSQLGPLEELRPRNAEDWAWAEQNWQHFLQETDSAESRLLIAILKRCEAVVSSEADDGSRFSSWNEKRLD